MMKSFLLALCCLVAVANAAPRANHKIVSMEDNEIPMKRVKGASVEFGGLRAGAGLGGSENGGGIWAGAEVPGQASAGAGLYGGNGGANAGASSGSPSGGVGGSGHGDKDGFFDRIFAIPINVLHSVNTYVKSKQEAHPGQAGAGPANKPESGDYNKPGNADYKPDSGDYGLGTGPNAQGAGGYGDAASAKNSESETQPPQSSHGHHRRPQGPKPDYDKIFNIPISALKSVNAFLNG